MSSPEESKGTDGVTANVMFLTEVFCGYRTVKICRQHLSKAVNVAYLFSVICQKSLQVGSALMGSLQK